jgi:hypothetical protein
VLRAALPLGVTLRLLELRQEQCRAQLQVATEALQVSGQ